MSSCTTAPSATGCCWGGSSRACRGEDIDDSGDTVDAANAGHAIASAEVDPTETVELLDRNGAAVLSVLRALTEDELARTVAFGPAGGAPFSVEQLAAAAARHGSRTSPASRPLSAPDTLGHRTH